MGTGGQVRAASAPAWLLYEQGAFITLSGLGRPPTAIASAMGFDVQPALLSYLDPAEPMPALNPDPVRIATIG